MIGNIELPDRVAKKTSRIQYFQIKPNESNSEKTREAYEEIQEVISGHERHAMDIVEMILEEANSNTKGMNLRSDGDNKPVVNVVIINPQHNFERDMLKN